MVFAVAAMAGLAVVAASSGSGERSGGARTRYERRRTASGPNVFYFGGPSVFDCMPLPGGGSASRSGARGAGTQRRAQWQPAPAPGATGGGGDTPWVVQAADRSLGSGAVARDAFFDRFSTNMKAALANAGYVARPGHSLPWHLILSVSPSCTIRERVAGPGRRTRRVCTGTLVHYEETSRERV